MDACIAIDISSSSRVGVVLVGSVLGSVLDGCGLICAVVGIGATEITGGAGTLMLVCKRKMVIEF